MNSHINDLGLFEREYPGWLKRKRELLEAGQFVEALADYPWVAHQSAPFSPFSGELSQMRVALLSTAGLFAKKDQPPFDAENIEGDWHHRELSTELEPAQLEIAHTHFNHQSAQEDLDSVYPIHRLRELAAGGVIGELAETAYSISGYCLQADKLVRQTIPAIVQGMQDEGVQAALFIPV